MAKAVILKTNEGIRLIGTTQCSNGAWWDAEGCFKYCQEDTEFISQHQAFKLCAVATSLGNEKQSKDWYKHRENFIDIEIPFECSQEYDWNAIQDIIKN